MPNQLSYTPGGVQSQTDPYGFSGGTSQLNDFLLRRLKKKDQLGSMSTGSRKGMASPGRAVQYEAPAREPSVAQRIQDELAMTNAKRQNDLSWQGAAMRPVGLGPQMIPGMGVDPRLLPFDLRPQQSQFQSVPQMQMQPQTQAQSMPDDPRMELARQQAEAQERALRYFRQFGRMPGGE